MNVNYKGLLIVILILLIGGCSASTSTDKNAPKNDNIVNDNNSTDDIVNDNNSTDDIVNDNNTADNPATIYEDAENQTTDKWSIISNPSKKANILNTYDDDNDSRVIYLDAKIIENNKVSYDTFKFDGINSKKDNKFIQWSMKFNQRFTISINIKTKNGGRWLQYIAKDTGAGYNRNANSITNGIGSNKTNNKWHTITRDLERDLKRYESDNDFIEINYMTIRGGGYIDDIKSYSLEDNLNVDKPVIVSQPGIVLTFDDSLANNWNEMQETFKEKGAVATFFTNRWASNENWNLTNDHIRLFKAFQNNGHEIGYHTSDHLNTKDAKYNNKSNKAQAYFDDQILPGITYMRNKGFEPTSFSYPYISGQPAHDELIRQELPHIRAFFAHVTLIDNPGNTTLTSIRKHLEKLKEDQDIGVFLSHWILDKDFETTNPKYRYRISKDKLKSIMDIVNELGLKFYTMDEAHSIYMNQ